MTNQDTFSNETAVVEAIPVSEDGKQHLTQTTGTQAQALRDSVAMALSNYFSPGENDLCYMEYMCPVRPVNRKWVTDANGNMELKETSQFESPENNRLVLINGILQQGVALYVGTVWEYPERKVSLEKIVSMRRNAHEMAGVSYMRVARR